MSLSKAEIDAVDLKVARVHAATGVRVVAAQIGKADTYEELPWKAFALGASLAAMAVVGAAHQNVRPAIIILAAGALAALLAIFVPAFGGTPQETDFLAR